MHFKNDFNCDFNANISKMIIHNSRFSYIVHSTMSYNCLIIIFDLRKRKALYSNQEYNGNKHSYGIHSEEGR